LKLDIGYPVGKNDITYYLDALKMAAPSIEINECKLLADKLKEYKNNKSLTLHIQFPLKSLFSF
jgi:hypothetical protein